jgi:hypothetical protein
MIRARHLDPGTRSRRRPRDARSRADGDDLPPAHAELLGLQRRAGNAAVAAMIQGARRPSQVVDGPEAAVDAGPVPGPAPGTDESTAVRDAPAKVYVGPFDRNPLSSPGERIIMEAEYRDATPSDYQLEWTATGGHFASQTGPQTLTQAGLASGNVAFFVPTGWLGLDGVRVQLVVRKLSDRSVARTETWSFGLKARIPTTMTQQQGGDERDLPSRYRYDIGPPIPPYAKPYYEHVSVLEAFENWRLANVEPGDIAEPYRNANGLTTAAAVSQHFLPAYAGSNGTFTVDHDDQIADKHNGHPNLAKLVRNLAAPKDVEVALPQTYESKPGTALGKYLVTRILKTDGTWKVRKEVR